MGDGPVTAVRDKSLLLKKYNAEEETKMNEKESPHQPDNLSNDDMRV